MKSELFGERMYERRCPQRDIAKEMIGVSVMVGVAVCIGDGLAVGVELTLGTLPSDALTFAA